MGLMNWLKPKRKSAPILHEGDLVEMQLRPRHGLFDARADAIDGRTRGVVWVTFREKRITSGKYAGSTSGEVIALTTGEVIGYFEPEALLARPDVVELLGKVSHATAFLDADYVKGKDVYEATVRFGPHRFMPKPFWE